MTDKSQQRANSNGAKPKGDFKQKPKFTDNQPKPQKPQDEPKPEKKQPEKKAEVPVVVSEPMMEEPTTADAAKAESQERKGRIFLKNLVFDTNEKMLRKLCTPFGEIKEISIPVDPSNNKPRGFAFVEFTNKNSAMKAVNSLNESTWKGRKIDVSLSVDKRRYQTAAATDGTPAPTAGEIQNTGDIEIVPVNPIGGEDKTAKKGKKKEEAKPAEKEEDPEMDELDAIVMRNIAAMGDEFEFDDEEELEEAADEEDGEPKAMMEEVDVKQETSKAKTKEKKIEDVEDLLEAANKEKQRELKKKQDDEDLSQTCFIRGVSYDYSEAQLAEFLKTNVGPIVYLKMVKFKADAAKHNGNGFVKFKDINLVHRLIEMTEQFNKGEYIPKPKDPKIELGGIRIQFFPALKKKDAADLKAQRDKELAAKKEPEDKKKRHNKKMNMEELIASDKSGKRRLAYSRLGFFDHIEETKLNELDRDQRKRHLEEKMIKMQNPNYFVSDKRVLLKNINRLLTDLQIRTLATEVLKGKLTEKEIKKAKIFSDVKLIESKSEESTGKSSVRVRSPRA